MHNVTTDENETASDGHQPTNRIARVYVDSPEMRLALYRAITDYCKPIDEDGMFTQEFSDWLGATFEGSRPGSEQVQAAIVAKVTALKLNHKNYVMALRPEVQQFVEAAEAELRQMAIPVLLGLRNDLKKTLNGHAR